MPCIDAGGGALSCGRGGRSSRMSGCLRVGGGLSAHEALPPVHAEARGRGRHRGGRSAVCRFL